MEGPRTGEVEFSLDVARSGVPTLSLAGRRVHSAYDPEREAALNAVRIARQAVEAGAHGIVLIGAALGYLPNALRERVAVPVIVWEPFAGLRGELGDSVRDAGLVSTNAAGFENALAAALPGDALAYVVAHPGYEPLVNFELRYALRFLRQRSGVGSRLDPDSAIVSQRSLETLARLPELGVQASLGACLAGRSVIVASGGPSLDPVLPALRERRGGVVLAAPQALARLLDHGVKVDFVVNPDPADLLTPILGAAGAPFGALLADSASHPAVLDRCPERTFLFHLRSPQVPQLAWESAGLPVIDEPLMTVSETACWLACELGAKRIVLAGADFASDTAHYGSPFWVRTQAGHWCQTNPVYFQGARSLAWVVAGAKARGCTELRRIGDGVAVPGVQPVRSGELPLWLEQDFSDSRAISLPLRGESERRLAKAVDQLLANRVPETSGASPYPESNPWLDFAPLAAEALAPAWLKARQTARGLL